VPANKAVQRTAQKSSTVHGPSSAMQGNIAVNTTLDTPGVMETHKA